MNGVFPAALCVIQTAIWVLVSWLLLRPNRLMLAAGISLGFALLTLLTGFLAESITQSTGDYVTASSMLTLVLVVSSLLPFALIYGLGGPASWGRTSATILIAAFAAMVLEIVTAAVLFGMPGGIAPPLIATGIAMLVQIGVSFAVAGIVHGLATKPGLMWGAIIGTIVLVAFVTVGLAVASTVGSRYGADGMVAPGIIVLFVLAWIVGLVIYFVPTYIALGRNHPQKVPIIVLNILAGWTFLGWIAALIWSLITSTASLNPGVFTAPSEFARADLPPRDFAPRPMAQPAPPPPPPQRQRNVADEIERLHRMMEQGMISREDYEKAKGKLLA